MKKINFKYFPLLFFSMTWGLSFGQKNLKLATKFETKHPNAKHIIKSIFIDKVSGDFIKEYDDVYKENGIITSNGKEYKLHNYEIVKFFSSNRIITYLTSAISEGSGSTKIRKYNIQKNSFELIDSLRFEAVGLDFNVLNNGKNFILGDVNSNFVFFGNDFKYKFTYNSFKNGYEFGVNCSDENQTVILAKESESNNYKIACFDSNCNLISEEKFDLNIPFRPNELFKVNNKVILGGLEYKNNDLVPKLICIDLKGTVLWENSLILGYGHIGIGVLGDAENMFILHNNKDYGTNIISKIEINTGRILKSINCDSIFYTVSQHKMPLINGKPNLFIRKFYLSNNNIYFSFVNLFDNDGSLLVKENRNGIVCFLDMNLNLINTTVMIPNLDVVDINLKSNNLMIVNSKKSINFEIPNN